jgi:uncharacterized protein YjbJ (UPF0337 family)
MDSERIKGAAKKVEGSIKEGVGKLTGDAKLQAEGKMDKAEGTVRNAVGGAKDAVRDAGK